MYSFVKMPSARRKRMLARRSREGEISSDDENSNVVIGNENRTVRSHGPDQGFEEGNFPNSVSSVSNHEIRPESTLRDITNDENRIRELIRAETGNMVNLDENMRTLSNDLNNRISVEMETLFENLNERMQRTIENALNTRNTRNDHLRSDRTLGHDSENVENGPVLYTENSGNTRAAFGDSNLNRVQSCADLRYSDGNQNNQALRIHIPEDDVYQLRTCHSVQNVSSGHNSNQMATENNHRDMGIESSHNMVAERDHHSNQ